MQLKCDTFLHPLVLNMQLIYLVPLADAAKFQCHRVKMSILLIVEEV